MTFKTNCIKSCGYEEVAEEGWGGAVLCINDSFIQRSLMKAASLRRARCRSINVSAVTVLRYATNPGGRDADSSSPADSLRRRMGVVTAQ